MRELQVGWPFSRSRGLAGSNHNPRYTGATRYPSRQRHTTPKSGSANHAWVIGRHTATQGRGMRGVGRAVARAGLTAVARTVSP